ncbi:MAG: thioredoxin family protein [Bacteroidetes bacterium]|nr:thioredoxin family protein [Bacteroidota bacterium]
MKKAKFVVLVSTFLLSFAQLFGQNKEIEFSANTWEYILAEAKVQNKLIFIDAYTTWCGPCKWAAKYLFTNKDVANYYNENFINVSMDMEKGDGIAFAKKFQINSYPTFLIINGKQEIISRTEGVDQTKKFITDFINFGKNAQVHSEK